MSSLSPRLKRKITRIKNLTATLALTSLIFMISMITYLYSISNMLSIVSGIITAISSSSVFVISLCLVSETRNIDRS